MEEPFLFHTVPHTLFEELIHSMDIIAVIGLASDGKAALAALQLRLPFFGLTFTPDHTAWLSKRLEGQVFKKYQDGTSKLHQPGLTALIGSNVGAEDPKINVKPPKPPPKRPSEGRAVRCPPTTQIYALQTARVNFVESKPSSAWGGPNFKARDGDGVGGG
jgi:hypothetical protein